MFGFVHLHSPDFTRRYANKAAVDKSWFIQGHMQSREQNTQFSATYVHISHIDENCCAQWLKQCVAGSYLQVWLENEESKAALLNTWFFNFLIACGQMLLAEYTFFPIAMWWRSSLLSQGWFSCILEGSCNSTHASFKPFSTEKFIMLQRTVFPLRIPILSFVNWS